MSNIDHARAAAQAQLLLEIYEDKPGGFANLAAAYLASQEECKRLNGLLETAKQFMTTDKGVAALAVSQFGKSAATTPAKGGTE